MALPGYDLYDEDVMGSAPAPSGYQEQDIMGPAQFSAPIAPDAAADPRNLIVQGGPTVPEGQISVNGELQPSQAAPQPLPWWIRAYDEYKAQRQAEDDAYRMLQRIQSDMPAGAGANSGQKAMQLQAKMMYDADLRRGVPPHEALAKHGVGLFGQTAPRAAVAAVRAGVPRTITPYEQERLALSREQLAESKAMHRATREHSTKQLESTGKKQTETGRLQAAQRLADQAEKELERDPRLAKRDPVRYKKLTDRIEQSAAILEQIAGGGAAPAAPAPAAQPAPAVNRVELAKQLSAANPKWTKAQVIAAVRKQAP